MLNGHHFADGILKFYVNLGGMQPNARLSLWINFNPSMDKQFHPSWNVGWNYSSNPKLQRCNRLNLGMDK